MTSNHQPPAGFQSEVFEGDGAAVYDDRFAAMAPVMDAMHLLMRLQLSDLPDTASILCAGAGTGAELLSLALAFPGWRFTAEDISASMLGYCKQKAEAAGVADRCRYHHGPIDTVESDAPFDAATAILVSQFLPSRDDRVGFYREIGARLRPGGRLVTADLSTSLGTPVGDAMLALWKRVFLHCGAEPEQAELFISTFGEQVAITPPDEINAILADAGFSDAVEFYSAGLIRVRIATKA